MNYEFENNNRKYQIQLYTLGQSAELDNPR